MNNRRSLEILEYLSLFGAGVGSVASVMFQQVIYASAPLSFSVLLNLILRNRLDQEMNQRVSPMVDRLDRQAAEEEKVLHTIRQKLTTLPTPEDLAKVRQEILIEAKQSIVASEDRIKKQLAPLEAIQLAPIEQELEKLRNAYSSLKTSLTTVTDRLGNAVPSARVQRVEETLAELVATTDTMKNDVQGLASRPSQEFAPLQQQLRNLRDEFNLLPPPPDVRNLEQELAILRQEVEQLLRASGAMVARQDLSTIYNEIEKLHQRHKGLSQSITPIRDNLITLQNQMVGFSPLSNNVDSLQKQVTSLSEQFQARPETQAIAGLKRALIKLSQGCDQLQQRMYDLVPASNAPQLDAEIQSTVIAQTLPLQTQLTSLQESLSLLQLEVFQLHEQQETLNNRQLELAEQQSTTFNSNQPSESDDNFLTVQIALLANRLSELESHLADLQVGHTQLGHTQPLTWIEVEPPTNGKVMPLSQDENHAKVEVGPSLALPTMGDTGWTPSNFRQVLSDLVARSTEPDDAMADLSDRQITLLLALEQTQERLVIVGNWLGQRYLDGRILRRFQDQMDQGVRIDLDCNALLEINPSSLPDRIHQQGNLTRLKNSSVQILRDLLDLQQAYPGQFNLTAFGLRDEFLVCDRTFAVVIQSPTLNAASDELEDTSETLNHLTTLGEFSCTSILVEPPTKPVEVTAEFCSTDPIVIDALIQQFDRPLPELATVAEYFHRAAIRYELGKPDAAIQDYNRILEIKPDDAIAYNNRGLVHYELENLEQAFADFNQALAIDAQNATIYANRGMVKADLEDWQGAIADYSEAIQLCPTDDIAYNNRGLLHSKLGNKQAAIADYSEAIRIKPNDEIAYFNRGAARSNLGDYRGAIADYSEAIRLNPYFANAHNNRGFAYQKLSNQQAAIADFDQALRINPNFANAYNNRGITRSKLGDFEGAIADFDQVIQINPDFANAYNNRGTVRSKLSDFMGALTDFDQAIIINPTFANAYSNRGLAYADMGNLDAATADLSAAARLLTHQGDKFASEQALQKLKTLQQLKQQQQISA